MTPGFRVSLAISVTAFAAIFSGCGPGADGFTVIEALGNYDVALDSNIVLNATYHNHAASTATVTFAQLGQASTTVSGTAVAYDAATNVFTVTLSQGSPSAPTIVKIDGSAVLAIDSNDAVVAFTPTTKNLKSVKLTIPVAGINSVTTVSTGCEKSLNEDLVITLTADGLDALVNVTETYETVGFTGTTPYVSCADYLAGVETILRAAGTDTSGLQVYVTNKGINIDFLSDLKTFGEVLHISGKKSVMASASKSLVIQSGPIADIQILR